MAISKEKKGKQLLELANQMREASSVVFTQYSGLPVSQISKLRKTLRESGATLKVIKKTLIKLAAKEVYNIDLDDKNLEGQVAVICSNEEITSGPKIVKTSSKTMKTLKLVGGILDGKVLSTKEVQYLADLPSKEELIAKLLGSFMSPIQGFYGVNKGVLSGFARVLDGHRQNLEKAT